MTENSLVLSLFMIFAGTALLSTLALYTRQSLLVAYIVLGGLLGPWGLNWVGDTSIIENIGEIGIVFLLFLLGLHLHPQKLLHMLKKVSWVALISSVVFLGLGYGISRLFGFGQGESFIIGAAMMFSSTIIGLKLLPTTILHHQHTGEVMIGVLLLQDLIAIIVLIGLHGAGIGQLHWMDLIRIVFSLPGLLIGAFAIEYFILRKLFSKFGRVREYIFLVAIAWCLGFAELASLLGLSSEVGAFIAGISIAASPIAMYIAESLKHVRDFFLVMFFFSIGASFNVQYLQAIIIPALVLAATFMIVKPVLYKVLLKQVGESKQVSWEVGVRLGQISEFSLLIAYLAADYALLSATASSLIQAATIFTFIVSSYLVVMRYPTPLATDEKLRKD